MCYDGPHSERVVVGCPGCGHLRCSECPVLKTPPPPPDNRRPNEAAGAPKAEGSGTDGDGKRGNAVAG
jgi:hypothetical protein